MSSQKPLRDTRIVVIACQVLQDLLLRLLPESLARSITFMDYGLHQVPARMTSTLQEALDEIDEPSLVVLGYGLCGNGLKGLKAGQHTLLVPRVDDCIALLLGSHRAYLREFEAEPGTYWLSKGWLESGSHPLKEHNEYVSRYGPEQAMWIMDQQYQHYQRLVLVAHSQDDLDAYRPQAQEVARFCERWGMHYQEILGSDRYMRQLVDFIQRARLPRDDSAPLHQANDDFLVVPPGGEIRQEDFMR